MWLKPIRYAVGRALLTATAIASPALAGEKANLRPNMGPVPIGSVAQWFGAGNYPPEAIRASRQGRVAALLAIDATGAVTGCTVQASSGTTVLDTATCEIATAHLRFDPATDDKGQPTASTYVLRVRWLLPGIDTPPPAPVDVTAGPPIDRVIQIEIAYDANGVALSCHSMISGAPPAAGDPCAGFKPGTGTPSTRRWLRNGQPVGVTVVLRTTEHVIPTP
jgi:TonB family protein